jgi:hypothetical protein
MASAKRVRPGEEFIFCTGATAATAAQCREELRKLTPDQFRYHVNQEKNDIFNWVRDCLDAALAGKIRDVTERDALVRALGPARGGRKGS